jgi:type IV pilus assembly protein PilM
MSLLGIYFGPKVIKIVEVKGHKVSVSTQIQQTAVSSGELEEKVPAEVKAVEIVAMFKDELRRHKIESKGAALCLSGKDLIIRTFEIPMIPKEEIESAVRFEAKKYIPFKVEDLITAHQLKFDRANRTHMVLFMGIKKEALDRYISILNQLDLKIHCVEYSAFSMLRHLKLNKLSDKGVVGVLSADLSGEDEANFTVLEDGFPLFSRDISLAEGQDLSGKPKGPEPADGLEKLK